MVAMIPLDKPEDSNLGENTAAERGKAVTLAKRGAFQLQISLFQRFHNTPVFIGSCYPSLSLRAIVPTEKILPT